MDAYLEEELYDLLTYCIQNSSNNNSSYSDNNNSSIVTQGNSVASMGIGDDLIQNKKARVVEIGKELAADGGVDAMENMFFAIENRIQGEIGANAKGYRSWWNGIVPDWHY